MIQERAQINAVSWAEVAVIKIEKIPTVAFSKYNPTTTFTTFSPGPAITIIWSNPLSLK